MNKNVEFGKLIVLSIATFGITIAASHGSLKVEAAKSYKRCHPTFHSEQYVFRAKVVATTISIFPAAQPDLVIWTNGQFS